MSRQDPTSTSGFGRFVAELKRRHVVRALLAYAAVVFVLLQAAEIVLPAFMRGPEADAALRVLVMAFVLLFPVILALAWVYEITPQGIRSMADLDAETGHVAEGRMLPRVALLMITMVAAGGAGLWWYRTDVDAGSDRVAERGQVPFVAASTTDASGPIRSLAVLPLENFSPESEGQQDYFTAGMHEALVSQLSQLSTVRVISRTSTAQLDRTGKSIPQIGAELGVDAVVEGSVLRVDGQVRITVQLIHAASDAHLWSEDYERDFSDVIALQRDVAQAIADEIRERLAAREVTDGAAGEPADRVVVADAEETPVAGDAAAGPAVVRSAEPRSTAPEVQEAFLRGRFAMEPESAEDAEEAAEHFESALRMDSTFTPALVGLAGARLVRGLAGDEVALEDLIDARRLAARALRQDPASAEAGEVLASVEQAIAGYGQRMATEVAGTHLRVVTTTGDSMVFVMGGDSIRVPSVGMMPTSTEFGSLMQVALARNDAEEAGAGAWLRGLRHLEAAGRQSQARDQAARAVARFEEHEPLHEELERLQALTGSFEAAVDTRRAREERFGSGPGPDADELDRRVERDGARGYWSWLLEDLRARRSAGEEPSWVAEAEALSALGRTEDAVAALERARRAHDPRLGSIRGGAVWDPLRGDPRFQRLLRSLGPNPAPVPPRPPGG